MSDLTAADFLPEPNFSRPTPDEMAQKIFDENPPEVRNVPSYFERQKDSAFDYVPTRDELRSGTFDVMHDTLGYSPRASRKTAEFLIGTKPGHNRSAMPIPDIGAADFVTGAAAKKFVDPLLMADAQQFRLDDEPGMSTLMAGLADMPPAAYAVKTAKLSGASDEVLEDIGMGYSESRRDFLKGAGIASLASQVPAPLIKAGKIITETPMAAKAVGTAAKVAAGVMKIPTLLSMAKVARDSNYASYTANTKNMGHDIINVGGAYSEKDADKIANIIKKELNLADDEAIISFTKPGSRYTDDYDDILHGAADDYVKNFNVDTDSGEYWDAIDLYRDDVSSKLDKIFSNEPVSSIELKGIKYMGEIEDIGIEKYTTDSGDIIILKEYDPILFYKVKKADLTGDLGGR